MDGRRARRGWAGSDTARPDKNREGDDAQEQAGMWAPPPGSLVGAGPWRHSKLPAHSTDNAAGPHMSSRLSRTLASTYLNVTEAVLAVGETTKVSHIPARACPGTPQIIMYVPAFAATNENVCGPVVLGSGLPGVKCGKGERDPANAGVALWLGRGFV